MTDISDSACHVADRRSNSDIEADPVVEALADYFRSLEALYAQGGAPEAVEMAATAIFSAHVAALTTEVRRQFVMVTTLNHNYPPRRRTDQLELSAIHLEQLNRYHARIEALRAPN